MMKFIVVACICLAVVQAHVLTEEQMEKLKTYKMACITSSGVDAEVVEKTYKGEYADDSKLKEFLFCVAKKVGFLNEDGDYQVDVLKAKITENHGQVAADDVVVSCTEKKEASGPETSFALAKCFYEKSKEHIPLA